jgi:hypothetical protein
VDSSLRIIVTGLIAQHRLLGGVTWDYLNVVLGVKRLGHDVYYIEDSGEWPYSFDGPPENNRVATDPRPTVEHLASVMTQFGLATKWAYHFPPTSEWFGLSDEKRKELIHSVDLLINVSGTLEKPEDYRRVRRLVYIDTDPVFTQIDIAGNNSGRRHQVNAHDVHFTVGECLGKGLPATGHRWHPTKHPVVLSEWLSSVPHRNTFTTVMNWTSYKVVTYCGRTYGQKDVEFLKFISLPQKVLPTTLEVALHKPHIRWPSTYENTPSCARTLNQNDTTWTPHEVLTQLGWRVVDATEVCPDFNRYRQYLQTSKGEWSVAKNGYVDGKSGWFSGRSACYLAAGRPVIVQDTGFNRVLPCGEGILSFNTLDEAEAGIREVEGNYSRHATAARDIAEAYFDSDKVVSRLLEIAMNKNNNAIN